MKDFTTYEVEDLLSEEYFIDWARNGQNNDFWNEWMAKNPSRAHVVEEARRIVQQTYVEPVQESLSDDELEEMIRQVRRQAETEGMETEMYPTPVRRSRNWAAAVMIPILMLGGYLTWQYLWKNPETNAYANNKNTGGWTETRNNGAEPMVIMLPDRSSVVLKPGSGLRFKPVFDTSERHVFLSGEAFFEVEKDPSRPFFVHANEMTTAVLGTSFTVRAFGSEDAFRVTVNTGKVSVFHDKKSEAKDGVTLLPDEQVVFHRSSADFRKETVSVSSPLSEQKAQKLFVFREKPLSEVITVLSEAYGVEIGYDKERMGKCPITASLSDQSLYEKLTLICAALNAEFTISSGKIILSGEGCSP